MQHPPEILVQAILDLLSRLPLRWETLDLETLTGTESDALELMKRTGLVEERLTVQANMEGFPQTVQARFRVTGKYDNRELGLRVASAVPGWLDSDKHIRGRLHFGSGSVIDVRLTDLGEHAQREQKYQAPESLSTARAFVLEALRCPVQGVIVLESCHAEKDKADSRQDRPANSPATLSRTGDADHEPDFMLPGAQSDPHYTAILDFLRTLTPHFTLLTRELTDAEVTAFRILAEKDAAEGIMQIVCTPENATEAVTEYHYVQGDYANAMICGSMRRDRPIDKRLVQARLTGGGERLASILRLEHSEDPVKVRAAVLGLLWHTHDKPGTDRIVSPPFGAAPPATTVTEKLVAPVSPAARHVSDPKRDFEDRLLLVSALLEHHKYGRGPKEFVREAATPEGLAETLHWTPERVLEMFVLMPGGRICSYEDYVRLCDIKRLNSWLLACNRIKTDPNTKPLTQAQLSVRAMDYAVSEGLASQTQETIYKWLKFKQREYEVPEFGTWKKALQRYGYHKNSEGKWVRETRVRPSGRPARPAPSNGLPAAPPAKPPESLAKHTGVTGGGKRECTSCHDPFAPYECPECASAITDACRVCHLDKKHNIRPE